MSQTSEARMSRGVMAVHCGSRARFTMTFSGFAVLALLMLFWPVRVFAQSQSNTEYQVKAAYLVGFTKFVLWPDSDPSAAPPQNGDDPFIVGVVGEDPFGPALPAAFADARVNGKKIDIEHLRWDQDLRNCQAIFIPQSERKHLGAILAKLKGSSVLTVSDISNFSSEGGMIGLIFDVDRIRFEINLDAATASHLQISSKLLTLARSVKGHPLVHTAD